MNCPLLCKILLIAPLLLASHRPAYAEELRITLNYLGLEKPSPFPGQLFVQIANESFTSSDLLERMNSSILWVDGKPLKRRDIPFHGPAGLSPKSSWEGCLSLEDYVTAPLPSGTHHLQLKIGNTISKNLKVKIGPFIPPASEPLERLHQVEVLAAILVPGMLQSCVETWLPEKDGGLQTLNPTHYYVSPEVKVLVSYEEAHPEPRVKGRIRMYNESPISD